MGNPVALVVIDSGFNQHSLSLVADRVIAIRDLQSGVAKVRPSAKILADFAGDKLEHGSIVLEKLARLQPALPVVLIKAFGVDGKLMRTVWDESGDVMARPGWTEAYLWAVYRCRELGYATVANCSFGTTVAAAGKPDWEKRCLEHVNVPGHIVVAAAGAGAGKIADPAAFDSVLSIGLAGVDYGAKPDVILSGEGPISFHIGEVVSAVATILADKLLAVREIKGVDLSSNSL